MLLDYFYLGEGTPNATIDIWSATVPWYFGTPKTAAFDPATFPYVFINSVARESTKMVDYLT